MKRTRLLLASYHPAACCNVSVMLTQLNGKKTWIKSLLWAQDARVTIIATALTRACYTITVVFTG